MDGGKAANTRRGNLLHRWSFLSAIMSDPELTDAARRVAFWLLAHYNTKTGQCNPGTDALAFEANLSRKSVFEAVKMLVGRGWLGYRRGGGSISNQYFPNLDRVTPGQRFFMADFVAGRVKLEWEGGVIFGTKGVTRASPEGVTRASPEHLKITPETTPKEKTHKEARVRIRDWDTHHPRQPTRL